MRTRSRASVGRVLLVALTLALPAGAWAETAAPAGAQAADEPSNDFDALADVLEPQDEAIEARLARQRAENAAVALFTFQTSPVDADAVRFRTSFYPLVHRAVERTARRVGSELRPAAALRAAAAGTQGRTALLPGLVAEHFALFRRKPEELSEADRLLLRQTSFYVAATERISAVRIAAAGGMKAVAASVDAERPTDFLMIGAIGRRVLENLGGPEALAHALDGLGFTPDAARAASVVALRSLGGPEPSSEELALLGLPADSPAARAVAGLGAVVLPFARRAADGDDDEFAARFLAVLEGEAGSSATIETDLHGRSHELAEAAALLAYVVKRVGVDAESLAARSR